MPDREYPRLKALVMAQRSAESLDLCELLRLAEDPACPPAENSEAYKWATRFAIPMIRELRDRLDTVSRKVDDQPRIRRMIEQMRKAQRGKDKDSREAWEAKVDSWLRNEFQPSLFEDSSELRVASAEVAS
jgi:hypothetical protein